MKKIKSDILVTSKDLFNECGVANVSIREIARKLNISASNLIYHFKSKNEIVDAIHNELFQEALKIHARAMEEEQTLSGLFYSIIKGFEVLYQYRFLVIDINLLVRENPVLHNKLLDVEKVRAKMYLDMIGKLIDHKLMRPPLFAKEYDFLVEQIRVFSDYWISSALVYDKGESKVIIKKYSKLFLLIVFPYLTSKGRKEFDLLMAKNNLS